MEHTEIVTATDLELFANALSSQAVIPELIHKLVTESVSDLTEFRIPFGHSINQPGWDGLVETKVVFRQFVPNGKSYWEIGTGANPQDKATEDFKKRTASMQEDERSEACYVFVTPYGAGTGGWPLPKQLQWKKKRENQGWREIKILDNNQIADWLRNYPVIGKWLLKEMGVIRKITGFSTPAEHWEHLRLTSIAPNDSPLPPKLFLANREAACNALQELFKFAERLLIFSAEAQNDVPDFIAAWLASLEDTAKGQRCLFINDPDAWLACANLKPPHVLVANPNLDLEGFGEQLLMAAQRGGHAVVISVSEVSAFGKIIPLRHPSSATIEKILLETGFPAATARELAGEGAFPLSALKRRRLGISDLPGYSKRDTTRPLSEALLIGRWAGDNPVDREAMEIALGKSYGEWIEKLRPETIKSDTPLVQRDEKWKIVSKGEAWQVLGPQIANEDLDRFLKAAVHILSEEDPKFGLEQSDRFAATIHGKELKHSTHIRRGVAETLALLGSRPQALRNCSLGKPEDTALLAVRKLLRNADWLKWASLNPVLPLLAEAAPEEFLSCMEGALVSTDNTPFKEVFAQEASGFMGENYMTGVYWALESLAWHPPFLARVTSILGDLAAIDPGGNWANRPANSLRDIFLPWYPQTCASVSQRIAAIQSLLTLQPAVGWKVLISLLPKDHDTTSDTHAPTWREFVPSERKKEVSREEYWAQIIAYSDLALGHAQINPEKLVELVDRLPDLPVPAFSRVLEYFISPAMASAGEAVHLSLWEALVELAAKHKKFSDARWALDSETVRKIEDAALKLEPSKPELLHRRLFSGREFDLFDEEGNYDRQREALQQRRKAAISEILESHGVDGVLRFLGTVADPSAVGEAVASVNSPDLQGKLLPMYLDSSHSEIRRFISSYVWAMFYREGWTWVNSAFSEKWEVRQKVEFFKFLPFSYETWRRADEELKDDARLYWKVAEVNPRGSKHLSQAADKLIEHQRPRAAMVCIHRLVVEKIDFAPSLAIRSLIESSTSQETTYALDHHYLTEIIDWLQVHPNVSEQDLFKVEWMYYPLLDRTLGHTAKTIERKLATEPDFFCELLSLVFRSDNEPPSQEEITEERRSLSRSVYKVLNGWHTPPGTASDGKFDGNAFRKWFEEFSILSKKSGHFQIGMLQLGKVLVEVPEDVKSLWIDRTVAEVLNRKEASEMRQGFVSQLFNDRGVHGYSAGREEMELANQYNKQAEELELNGYHLFAGELRGLAKNYERDAQREAERNPYEPW